MSYQYKRKRLSKTETRDEHRLIMEDYLGRPLEDGEIVHHVNGDPTDDRIDNLELCTRSAHATYHLTGSKLSEAQIAYLKLRPLSHWGSGSPQSKLTEMDIPAILQLIKNNVSVREIAHKYGVSHSTILAIKNRKSWKHVVILHLHTKQQSLPLEFMNGSAK